MSDEQQVDWLELFDRFQSVLDGLRLMSEKNLSPENRERLRGLAESVTKRIGEVYVKLRRQANPDDPMLAQIEQMVASLPEGRDLLREYLEGLKPDSLTKQ